MNYIADATKYVKTSYIFIKKTISKLVNVYPKNQNYPYLLSRYYILYIYTYNTYIAHFIIFLY